MPATEQMSGIHHRMPVLVSAEHFTPWLLAQLEIDDLIEHNDESLLCYQVDSRVNNARNDDPSNVCAVQ